MVVYTTMAVLVETITESRLKFAADVEYILRGVEIIALVCGKPEKNT